MSYNLKKYIRIILTFLRIDITKNIEYDRLTKAIIKRNLIKNSNCIDVGCHKGDILDIILKYAPNGFHFAFEPLPHLFIELDNKYSNKVKVFPFALSDFNGTSSFMYVKNAPAYSGIRRRNYDISNPIIDEIKVEIRKMGDIIPSDLKIDFIKIDVEGGEFGVLKGAKEIILKNRPYIIFEFGIGASDYYGTDPNDIFNFICEEMKMNISTLKCFYQKRPPLRIDEFINIYNSNSEYYFIVYP